jgi:hypothetical protein
MKKVTLAIALTIFSMGQSGAASFAGSWTAQFQGRTFVRLELKTANGAITGGISLGDIEVDDKGALRRVGEPPRDLTPVFEVRQRGSILMFARKDGTDTDRFELRVLEGGRAELQFLPDEATRKEIAASGIPVPKPIPLTRQ